MRQTPQPFIGSYGKTENAAQALAELPGCVPARCGISTMQATMTAAMTADAIGRLSAIPPCIPGLVEKIANRRAKRTGQDERGPEQEDARHAGPGIRRREERQAGGKDESAAFVTKPAGIRHPIAESGAECLRDVMAAQ